MPHRMMEYPLLDSQDMGLVALDFLRILDFAQEDGLLKPAFALNVSLNGRSTPFWKSGQWKTEKYRSHSREPIRGYTQAMLFLRGHLSRFAHQSPRGLETLRVEVEEMHSGVRFAALL